MSSYGSGGPPPGWYPDPAGVKAWRWWDGRAWTGYASDPTAAPGYGQGGGYGSTYGTAGAAGPAYGAAGAAGSAYGPAYGAGTVPHPGSVHGRFASEVRMAPWARRALLGYVVIVVVGLLVAWSDGSVFRQIIHDIRIQQQTGVVVPLQPSSNSFSSLGLVSFLVDAAFYVLVLVWQYNAADTARQLFLPARRSPGLGVGSWFIPVVNLWFPYQALRDCLPPGDPGRTAVGRMWAFFISVLIMNLITAITALAGNPVGLILGAVTVVLALGFGLQGSRAVRLIGETHRRLLYPGTTGPPG